MNKYIMIKNSRTGHCCFNFTIVDSKTDSTLCECFEEEDAKIILNALNYFHNKIIEDSVL